MGELQRWLKGDQGERYGLILGGGSMKAPVFRYETFYSYYSKVAENLETYLYTCCSTDSLNLRSMKYAAERLLDENKHDAYICKELGSTTKSRHRDGHGADDLLFVPAEEPFKHFVYDGVQQKEISDEAEDEKIEKQLDDLAKFVEAGEKIMKLDSEEAKQIAEEYKN